MQRALGLFGGRKKQIDEAAARDREDFLGKLKMANANEVVDRKVRQAPDFRPGSSQGLGQHIGITPPSLVCRTCSTRQES